MSRGIGKGAGRSRRKLVIRLACLVPAPFLLYAVSAVVLGFIPASGSWRPAADGRTIYVASNGIHVDLYLPTEAAPELVRLLPLTNGSGSEASAPWIGFGWGERRFYLETPEWSDLRVATVLAALFTATRSVMHVTYRWSIPSDREFLPLVVDEDELSRLKERILEQFARGPDGSTVPIPGEGYWEVDDFYEAVGSYHLFQTCNDWANQCLAGVGLPAAMWSPTDTALLFHVRRAGERPPRER